MIILKKLKINRELTSEFWKKKAQGTKDQYGNPFRIITLHWLFTRMRPNTEYSKTRGFEDAVISKNESTGGFKITYRANGSVMWLRAPGGVGPFYGELAVTPRNLKRLASMYGDKLWTIVDADIDQVVKALYQKRFAKMSDEEKEFNKKRIAAMNTHRTSTDIKLGDAPVSQTERELFDEEQRKLEVEKQELAKKKAEVKNQEKAIVENVVKDIEKGVSPVAYTEEYLSKVSFNDRKKILKELGVKVPPSARSADLLTMILAAQEGKGIKPAIDESTSKESDSEDELLNQVLPGTGVEESDENDGFESDENENFETGDDDTERLDG